MKIFQRARAKPHFFLPRPLRSASSFLFSLHRPPPSPSPMRTKVFSLKMMRMAFCLGKKVAISFDSWRTDSSAGYHLRLFALFAVAAFRQCMEDILARFNSSSYLLLDPSSPLPRSSSPPPQPPGSGRLLGP